MATLAERLSVLHRKAGRWTIAGLPEGADSLALAEIAKTTGGQDILHVARDGQRLERLQDGLRFFAPEREVLVFPAWDCLPYDRLSPHPDIVAERLETLARLADARKPGSPANRIVAPLGVGLPSYFHVAVSPLHSPRSCVSSATSNVCAVPPGGAGACTRVPAGTTGAAPLSTSARTQPCAAMRARGL